MCQTDVEFEQIEMKISKKNCQTLERYGKGAAARRETNKMKTACIKSIIGKYLSRYGLITNSFIMLFVFCYRFTISLLYG